jgi:hypothetical protein
MDHGNGVANLNAVFSLCSLQKALRKAHIYPRNGRRYEAGHIVAAIDHAFGSLPHLVCKNGSVQELRLCFHKDYQVHTCHNLHIFCSPTAKFLKHGYLILCSPGIAGRRMTMRGRATGEAIALATSPSRPTNSLVILL